MALPASTPTPAAPKVATDEQKAKLNEMRQAVTTALGPDRMHGTPSFHDVVTAVVAATAHAMGVTLAPRAAPGTGPLAALAAKRAALAPPPAAPGTSGAPTGALAALAAKRAAASGGAPAPAAGASSRPPGALPLDQRQSTPNPTLAQRPPPPPPASPAAA